MTPTQTRYAHSLDPMADVLAEYVRSFPARASADDEKAAKRVLVDSLAVAIGGLESPPALAARRFAENLGNRGACRIWGTTSRATPEVAALVNGVPLRAYDYNDLYIGTGDAAHPSDIVPALLAVAEQQNASVGEFLVALALGYDVTLALLESCTVGPRWDYPNLVAIGATSAMARLFALSAAQTAEALGITVVSHAASGEIESGELNRHRDLTMWKRFNGSDAMRQSVYACLLARAGIEGPVRPFTGTYGFLNSICQNDDAFARLQDQLASKHSRIGDSTFKRWPVGSRAQSAVHAALRAREGIRDAGDIREVRVVTNAATFRHLVALRDDPWAPVSRETADHSLPYIVAAAILDGRLDVASFEPATVKSPARQEFVRARIRIEPGIDVPSGDTTYPSSVQIEMADGRRADGAALPPPGHRLCPFDDEAFEQKFVDCSSAFIDAGRALALVRRLLSMNVEAGVGDCLDLLASALGDRPMENACL